jgi:hypothetical protein
MKMVLILVLLFDEFEMVANWARIHRRRSYQGIGSRV